MTETPARSSRRGGPATGPSPIPRSSRQDPGGTEAPAQPDRTPDSAHRFQEGEKVRSVRSIGGTLGGAVPAGTEGKVVSVQHRLFDERVTVEFANGYREDVPLDAIKYESRWY